MHGQPGDPPPIGAVATITTATALVDRMADAVGWGIEIAQYVTAATDAPVSVLTNVYGQMGEITWIGVQPDLAAAEAVRLKLSGDMDYLGRMAATKELYVPASGHVAPRHPHRLTREARQGRSSSKPASLMSRSIPTFSGHLQRLRPRSGRHGTGRARICWPREVRQRLNGRAAAQEG